MYIFFKDISCWIIKLVAKKRYKYWHSNINEHDTLHAQLSSAWNELYILKVRSAK